VNDLLANNPDRFAGFAALPRQVHKLQQRNWNVSATGKPVPINARADV
jgi:hypothetical protein